MFKMMKKLRSKAQGKQKGFTIIELIVVIVIIGILAATATFVVSGSTDKAKYARANNDLDSMASAISLTYVELGSKFGTITAAATGAPLSGAFVADTATAINKALTKPLADMTDPWGKAYTGVFTAGTAASAGTAMVPATLQIMCQGTDAKTPKVDPYAAATASANMSRTLSFDPANLVTVTP